MWVQAVVVKSSITKNKSISNSLKKTTWSFFPTQSFPIFAWGMCIVMVLCHGGTANRRYSTSKGNCQVQDKRGKALQGMTAGCTHRPHKTVLFIFSSVCFSLCSHQSEHVSLLLCVCFFFYLFHTWIRIKVQSLSHISITLPASHLTVLELSFPFWRSYDNVLYITRINLERKRFHEMLETPSLCMQGQP